MGLHAMAVTLKERKSQNAKMILVSPSKARRRFPFYLLEFWGDNLKPAHERPQWLWNKH